MSPWVELEQSAQRRSVQETCYRFSRNTFHTRKRLKEPIGELVTSQVPGCTRGTISYVIVHRRTPAENKQWIYNCN